MRQPECPRGTELVFHDKFLMAERDFGGVGAAKERIHAYTHRAQKQQEKHGKSCDNLPTDGPRSRAHDVIPLFSYCFSRPAR